MSGFKPKALLADALPKIRRYCAYRDRCHKEVKLKLRDLGLWTRDIEVAIATLIEEGFLNEERFARSYARGHFRMKNWGRVKIIHGLRSMDINETLIRSALNEIDEVEYMSALQLLVEKKMRELDGSKKQKTLKLTRYLLSKGYELPVITASLSNILK